MLFGIIAGMFVIIASVLGSALGLVFKKISHKTNDIFLGFAAGIMFTAAFSGLLPTAFSGGSILSVFLAVAGIITGAWFISLLDKFVPHLHFNGEQFDESETKSTINRTLLLVLAIAIHNIPEGLATGIVFGHGLTDNAIMMAISMALQKIPEGFIVIIPLLSMGMKRSKAFGFSLLVAAMMLPGVIIGAFVGSLPLLLEVFFYAFTFGAIIYVVSDEIIPESHSHGFQRQATFALFAGIISVSLIQFL